MTTDYVPVFRVETDGNGKYLGVTVCTCDTGEADWPGHSEECPLHD